MSRKSRNKRLERRAEGRRADNFQDSRQEITVLHPRNEAQKKLIQAIDRNVLTFATGPAGTGKTLLAIYKGVQALVEGLVEKIIVARAIVQPEGDRGIGFIPGTAKEKTDPYLGPLMDNLCVFMPKGKAQYMIEKGQIEFMPLEYMRGRSLNDTFLIIEEAQNMTPHNMLTTLTRIGKDSIVVVTGDSNWQRDLEAKYGIDGLTDATIRLKGVRDIGHVEFEVKDIVRSGIVRDIMFKYAETYQ